VTLRIFGCRKFSRLISERTDRDLNLREERFLERHRVACSECRRSEVADDCVLNLLRASALEPEVEAPTFDDRILRRLRVQTVRDSLSYWSPAIAGAGIAGIALFVALHLAAMPSQIRRNENPGGEAVRFLKPTSLPNLELSDVPQFER